MSDLMFLLYGKSGDKGLSRDIRYFVEESLDSYFSDKTDEEIQSYLEEIDNNEDFPQFEMDWYELLNNYLESR